MVPGTRVSAPASFDRAYIASGSKVRCKAPQRLMWLKTCLPRCLPSGAIVACGNDAAAQRTRRAAREEISDENPETLFVVGGGRKPGLGGAMHRAKARMPTTLSVRRAACLQGQQRFPLAGGVSRGVPNYTSTYYEEYSDMNSVDHPLKIAVNTAWMILSSRTKTTFEFFSSSNYGNEHYLSCDGSVLDGPVWFLV